MNILKKLLYFLLFCLSLQFASADYGNFIALPNRENLFKEEDKGTESNPKLGLWLTPINQNARPGPQSTYESIGNIPNNVDNVLKSPGPNQLLNNLFNSTLLNQVGVGFKVNF